MQNSSVAMAGLLTTQRLSGLKMVTCQELASGNAARNCSAASMPTDFFGRAQQPSRLSHTHVELSAAELRSLYCMRMVDRLVGHVKKTEHALHALHASYIEDITCIAKRT